MVSIQATPANAQSGIPGQADVIKADSSSGDLPALPSLPRGKSTIFGGEIRNVDPVRDQLTLKVFGQKPMRLLFDERTQAYRDGKRISLLDLRPEDHASVETMLDGTHVFAVSIHILSQSPEGEYQGSVLSYSPETGELSIGALSSREPFKVLVPKDTSFVREGQSAFSSTHAGPSDLVKGTLVSIKFASGKLGQGVASRIAILAVPGSTFVFTGNLTSLDLHSGSFILVNPQDQQSYQISFDSTQLPEKENLHVGDHVRVTTDYDGARYVAREVVVN